MLWLWISAHHHPFKEFPGTLDFKKGQNEWLLPESEVTLFYGTYFVPVCPTRTLKNILYLHSILDNCFEYQIQKNKSKKGAKYQNHTDISKKKSVLSVWQLGGETISTTSSE